jgi:hypothetical protein
VVDERGSDIRVRGREEKVQNETVRRDEVGLEQTEGLLDEPSVPDARSGEEIGDGGAENVAGVQESEGVVVVKCERATVAIWVVDDSPRVRTVD